MQLGAYKIPPALFNVPTPLPHKLYLVFYIHLPASSRCFKKEKRERLRIKELHPTSLFKLLQHSLNTHLLIETKELDKTYHFRTPQPDLSPSYTKRRSQNLHKCQQPSLFPTSPSANIRSTQRKAFLDVFLERIQIRKHYMSTPAEGNS